MHFNPSIHDPHSIPFQPIEIQQKILSHLSFRDLDTISQVSWAYLRISRNMSILDMTYRKIIKVIESFQNPQLVDTAYLILLKSIKKTQKICQQGLVSQVKTSPIIQDSRPNVSLFLSIFRFFFPFPQQAKEIENRELTIIQSEIIQAIRDPKLRCSQLLSLSPSPALQKAREAAKTIEGYKEERLSVFLSIAQISREPEDFRQVLNTAGACSTLDQILACIEVAKNRDDPNPLLKAIREDITARHVIFYCPELAIAFSKIAEISSDPQHDLNKAREFANKIKNEKDLFNSRLNILFVSLKITLSSNDPTDKKFLMNDKKSLQKAIEKLLASSLSNNPLAIHWLYEGVKQALHIDLDVARFLAHQIPVHSHASASEKVQAFLDIAKISQDRKDFDEAKELIHTKKESFYLIIQVTQIALEVFKDLDLAREVANQVNPTQDGDIFNQFKAFLEILKISQDQEDLQRAKQLAFTIKYAIYQFGAFRKLFELTEDEQFLKSAIQRISTIKGNITKSFAYIELARLTRKREYLEQARENARMIEDENNRISVFYKISEAYVKNFKNFELARTCIEEIEDRAYKVEAISHLVMASEDLKDFDLAKRILGKVELDALFLNLTKKMILQKKIDEVQQFDQLLYAHDQVNRLLDQSGEVKND